MHVVPNPHMVQDTPPSCAEGMALSPHDVLRELQPTQPDTLQSIATVRYGGVDVPVYNFKQPARLNPRELPFAVVLVRPGAASGANLLPLAVEPSKAADSWFPGLAWDVLVRADCADVVHMGWRFRGAGGAGFDALIVAVAPDDERERVLTRLDIGVPAPAWIATLFALHHASAPAA